MFERHGAIGGDTSDGLRGFPSVPACRRFEVSFSPVAGRGMSWRRVSAHSIYVLLATAALAVLQWVIVAMIARREGSVALGEYALSQAFAVPGSYLAWLSLRQQLLVSGGQLGTASDMMFLRLAFPLVVFGGILAFIAVSYKSQWLLAISACVLAQKYIEGFLDLSYAYMQKSNNWKSLAISTVVRCALLVVVFATAYVLADRLAVALIAVTGFSVLFYLIFDRRFDPSVRATDLFDFSRPASARRWGLVVLLLPLAVSSVVMSLTMNAPRFLIDVMLGPAELGYFAAVSHFVVLGAVATGSVGHAILPVLAEAIRDQREREFWRQLIVIMVAAQVACGLGIAASVFFGGELLRLLYGNAFAGQALLLTAAAVAAGPVYCASIAANGCYAAGLRRELLASQAVALLIVMLTTLAALRSWGNFGAFGGMLAGGVIQLIFCLVFLRRFWRRHRTQPLQALTERGGG
jgi:O-antigen/teichoic acid export membrane protein